jgi:hypothetical protein
VIFGFFVVMPGPVPGIHVFPLFGDSKAWITGTRRAKAALRAGRGGPVMTQMQW